MGWLVLVMGGLASSGDGGLAGSDDGGLASSGDGWVGWFW